jgi:dolichol-phosphate mannosyltransferase
MDISVIIPIYNEEGNIPLLHERLTKVMQGIGVDYELVFVNDGSVDKSMELIKELNKKDSNIKYIDLSRNFGHQIAVSAAIDKVQGDAVVIIDADLQDPPELI